MYIFHGLLQVQVRQKAINKKTFFYLEQLILKHKAHEQTLGIKPIHGKCIYKNFCNIKLELHIYVYLKSFCNIYRGFGFFLCKRSYG